VWGLQRSGTNLLESLLDKSFTEYTPWLYRLADHITKHTPANVPLCRKVEEHCVAMARAGVLKHTIVWKHFHIQATAWPAGGVTRQFGLKPGTVPRCPFLNRISAGYPMWLACGWPSIAGLKRVLKPILYYSNVRCTNMPLGPSHPRNLTNGNPNHVIDKQ
jgi:hypothetical protein